MPLPKGILAPTGRPEAEQGGDAVGNDDLAPAEAVARDEPSAPVEAKAPRTRKKRAAPVDKTEGRRLYLSEQVHFRLRMLAYQRKQKISEVAEDVLDKALPKWDVNRVG
jgi:hypothetical protein